MLGATRDLALAKNGISSVDSAPLQLCAGAADGLGRDRRHDHGGDCAARGGDAAYGAGRDGDAYLGGVRPGKRGRGAAGITAIRGGFTAQSVELRPAQS